MSTLDRPDACCPHCGTAGSPMDIAMGYCARCHWWTLVPELYGPWKDEREEEGIQPGRDGPPTFAELDLWTISASPNALVVAITCRGCGGTLTVSRSHTAPERQISVGRLLRAARRTTHLDGCRVPGIQR